MKTKNPKCIKCNKPMKVIYTKRSYELNSKYKVYWNKEGYICNHVHTPFVILNPLMNMEKYKDFRNYLVNINDIDFFQLKESLIKIFKFLI